MTSPLPVSVCSARLVLAVSKPRPKRKEWWSGRAHTVFKARSIPAGLDPGSGLIDADVVLEADPDVIGHINGGHTALPLDQIRCLCERCLRAVEIVHNGNELAALHAVRTHDGLGQLSASFSVRTRPPAVAFNRSGSCG